MWTTILALYCLWAWWLVGTAVVENAKGQRRVSVLDVSGSVAIVLFAPVVVPVSILNEILPD